MVGERLYDEAAVQLIHNRYAILWNRVVFAVSEASAEHRAAFIRDFTAFSKMLYEIRTTMEDYYANGWDNLWIKSPQFWPDKLAAPEFQARIAHYDELLSYYALVL